MKPVKAQPKPKAAPVPKAPVYRWMLSGPCPICASPVLYSLAANDDIHVRRTCPHNVPPVMSGSGAAPAPVVDPSTRVSTQ